MDFQFLNDLADTYYYATDKTTRDDTRSRLWEGAFDLIHHVNLECALLDREDLLQEISTQIGVWIDKYNPSASTSAGGFIGYIASNAKLKSKNIYREARSGGYSRRTLEGKNQIKDLVSKGVSLREAKIRVVLDTGMGLDLYKKIEEALTTEDTPRSFETPISTVGTMTLGDTLRSKDADQLAVFCDRSEIRVAIERLPPRYNALLTQVSEGKDPFSEIKFGRKLTVAQKAIAVDTALKLLHYRTMGSKPLPL